MKNTETMTMTETQRDTALFNGRHIKPIGGRYWRCADCDKQIEAECECCEPPRCKCGA